MKKTKRLFDPENLFFISDTHFDHGNILKFQSQRHQFLSASEKERYLQMCSEGNVRGKGLKISEESIARMNDSMVDQWNSVVSKDSDVIFMGDFAWTNSWYWRQCLNGNIYFIIGNHDDDALDNKDLFEWIRHYSEITVDDKDKEGSFQKICCFHFPLRTWNRCHHGSFHLHGHEHGSLSGTEWGRSMDVGIDHIKKPISYQEVKSLLLPRPLISHHD